MFISVFVEVTVRSQAHLHVLQTDSVPFVMSYSVDLVKAWFQMERGPHTAGIVQDFLKETSRNRILSDFLKFVVEVSSGQLCHPI
jgi:hypothetical protein